MKRRTTKYLLLSFLLVLTALFFSTSVWAAAGKTIQITANDLTIKTKAKKKAIGAKASVKKADLSYQSSNPKIVTVDSKGSLLGKKAGSAEITITAKKKGYQTAKKKIKITVVRSSQTIKLKKKPKSIEVKSSIDLGAAAGSGLSYKSSDPSVLKVSKTGKITGLTADKSADITITAKRTGVYEKASLTITVNVIPRKSSLVSSVTDNWITVETPGGTRKYHRYWSYSYRSQDKYYPSHGCVVTAVSVAASAMGSDHSPVDIHMGSKTKKYSENYALVKLGATKRVSNAALGLPLASQILTDMGIPNKRVSSFNKEKAIKEITKHLKSGKPVIVKAHNQTVNGVKVGFGHHALVIMGIDEKGNGIFYDTSTGKVNVAHGNNAVMKMSIRTFVNNHMHSASGNYESFYVSSLDSAGGYILVG